MGSDAATSPTGATTFRVNEPDEWLQTRSVQVLDEARTRIATAAASSRQEHWMRQALELSVCGRSSGSYCAPVHLPLLVYAGMHADEGPAIPLAAAMSLLWAGAELYDNQLDHELPREFAGMSGAAVTMIAFGVGFVLPQAIVGALDVPEATRVHMQQRLAAGILQMFEGQTEDVALADQSDAPPETVEASVRGKNGAAKALFTSLAAEMAGGDPARVRAYDDFGMAFGVVYQLQSDASEMFQDEWCRDLARGSRTLQITLHLAQLSGQELEAFLETLDAARTDAAAQASVRSELRRVEAIRPWLTIVRRYALEAEDALDRAAPTEPARGILLRLLRRRSPGCQGID